uniref:2-methoxy-6-polyprenyl-1,4-benzoquinol methylase, mitochondrial n=1 Tax=Ciona intestinalis TaxID=7719 RepID=UPI000180BE79|nr:2-methoxy-6-polyprenyl-1,4-benzoquinol methylase, mitochondrial [Ciona intestinalis]|eukprot:XP_002121555.1 2-methoxy-6-polyprenyl-1,4-benzoquinol methylase, mitochondrial [Ciona intestinalis]
MAMTNNLRFVSRLKAFRCFEPITRLNRNVGTQNANPEITHFGFKNVTVKEKPKKVNEVFDRVAGNYDLMNDVMSAGIHRLWKDRLITVLNPCDKTKLLDCAGGTGDISFRFIKRVKLQHDCPEPNVTVCDINPNMLEVGKRRAETQNLHLKWVCCSADDLCFPGASFNAYTIAFGIRNCTHIDKVLKEAYRVLEPGGRFLCLEFSEVENPYLRNLYNTYSFQVIPVMGEVISGDWKSYQYLAESIRKFPSRSQFSQMMRDAGFQNVSCESLTFGVCSIHSGFKL